MSQTPIKSTKEYKSLGAMLKAGDFEILIKDLTEMKSSGELKKLSKTTEQSPISEFDDLLFFFPEYSVVATKDENGERKLTKELIPRALELLEFLLENGANPNAYMKNGVNTYLKSCEVPNVAILDYLINNPFNKVNLSHTDGMGNTGLLYATMSESIDVIDYLVNKCNFNVNEKNILSNNQTVLHYACGNGKEASFDKLIELNANPSMKDSDGYKPLDTMLLGYDPDTIEEYMDEPETLQMWKNFYDRVAQITTVYEVEHKPKFKTKF
ncbi:hypothetical protein GW796_00310 [archaeon]|nr:hypothetical protein [archaeon]